MNASRFGLCVLLPLLVAGCGSSPTEPAAPSQTAGTLLVSAKGSCSVPVTVTVRLRAADGTSVSGRVDVPGETRITVAAGRYQLLEYTVSATGYPTESYAGALPASVVDVPVGGTATLELNGLTCPR